MGSNPKWSGGLVYVDLFGGPGVCKVRESDKRIPGSPLLAAWAPKPFRKILICEKEIELAHALNARLASINVANRADVIVGDCNSVISLLVEKIPDRALTLSFVDPEGLHVHFDTLRTLTMNRQVDLAVLFADRMDIVRNVNLYASQLDSNLDRFLGPGSNWREQWRNLANQDAEHTCQLFGDIFKGQLKRELGLREFSDQVYKSARSALYRIIYASRHPLGLKFWNEISKIDRGGQRTLGF